MFVVPPPCIHMVVFVVCDFILHLLSGGMSPYRVSTLATFLLWNVESRMSDADLRISVLFSAGCFFIRWNQIDPLPFSTERTCFRLCALLLSEFYLLQERPLFFHFPTRLLRIPLSCLDALLTFFGRTGPVRTGVAFVLAER